jgi:hypothetical protein
MFDVMKEKGKIAFTIIIHLFGLYVLYAYLYEVLRRMSVNIYISEFHYQSVDSLWLRGPLFILIGFILFKNRYLINKIGGIFYLIVGIYWFYTIFYTLSQK